MFLTTPYRSPDSCEEDLVEEYPASRARTNWLRRSAQLIWDTVLELVPLLETVPPERDLELEEPRVVEDVLLA